MIVKTLFHYDGRLNIGEVEIKLMPGIPQLHVVGQPDAHIRECGMRLKSALRSSGLEWPKGHQIVVNLRPSHLRKSSSGADLAIAIGFLALTNQVSAQVGSLLARGVIFGEVGLDGRVFAPSDLPAALRAGGGNVITGASDLNIRDGSWWEISSLRDGNPVRVSRHFNWQEFWVPPECPDFELNESAIKALWLAVHANLNVLVAGPQGTGKTSWCKALYALTTPPDVAKISQLQEMFGDEVLATRWRPFENPHHSVSPAAMIGALEPGVISRAHGGILLMDEFLEFDSEVLEGMREPIESGSVYHARLNGRARFPAEFQLLATTNLCPCGKLNPAGSRKCAFSLIRCRSVCSRLSGPLLDRFDMLVLSHEWIQGGPRRSWTEVRDTLEKLRLFVMERGPRSDSPPEWLNQLEFSHRRRRSLMRVARCLADFDGSDEIQGHHFLEAQRRVIDPMAKLNQLFA